MTESEFQSELEVENSRGWLAGFTVGAVFGFSCAMVVVLIARACGG
jgi:hypothetical protein